MHMPIPDPAICSKVGLHRYTANKIRETTETLHTAKTLWESPSKSQVDGFRNHGPAAPIDQISFVQSLQKCTTLPS